MNKKLGLIALAVVFILGVATVIGSLSAWRQPGVSGQGLLAGDPKLDAGNSVPGGGSSVPGQTDSAAGVISPEPEDQASRKLIGEAPPISGAPSSESGAQLISSLTLPSLTKVIKTAQLSLKLKKGSFDRVYNEALSVVGGAGGYVTSSSSGSDRDRITSAYLTIRVPADRFEATLAKLKKLAKVQSININGQDVSQEFVDLESRLRNWKAQEAVLLALMQKAKTIEESIMIQNSLSQIQMEIETITGRLNYLKDQTGFATVNLSMSESGAPVIPADYGLRASFREAIRAAAQVIGLTLIGLGYLIPLSIIIGLPFLAYWLHRRRRPALV